MLRETSHAFSLHVSSLTLQVDLGRVRIKDQCRFELRRRGRTSFLMRFRMGIEASFGASDPAERGGER